MKIGHFSDDWANIVKSGNPNGPELPRWPGADAAAQALAATGDRLPARPVVSPEKRRLTEGLFRHCGIVSMF